MLKIDLNADAGESFGRWPLGDDAGLFPFLTSVNLACGFHAGDPLTMRRSIALAKQHHVQIGAHPGFPDKEGFGRRDMALSADELYADTVYQIGALQAFLALEQLPLHHVKPHGALHHATVRDPNIAQAVIQAVHDAAPGVPLVALAGQGGQIQQDVAASLGVPVVLEAFPERAYLSSGKLAPRTMAGSSIHDPQKAAERALHMVRGSIISIEGDPLMLRADTLCIHGDNPHALAIAQAITQGLQAEGVTLEAF